MLEGSGGLHREIKHPCWEQIREHKVAHSLLAHFKLRREDERNRDVLQVHTAGMQPRQGIGSMLQGVMPILLQVQHQLLG